MAPNDRLEFLKSVDIFADADAADVSAVAAICTERTCEPGDEIFREGAPANSVLIVREGSVRCTRGGDEITRIARGEAFGVTSFLDQGTRNVDATAEGRVRLVVLDRAPFAKLLKERPALAEGIHSVTRKHLRSVLDMAATHRGSMA